MAQDTIYIITNKTTGETKEVILHTAGTGFVTFAEKTPEYEWANARQYRFENPDKSDQTLTSEEWTIVKK